MEHILGENQAFTRSRDNMPETQSVHHVSKVVHYGDRKSLPVTIIDTPGLNEDDVHDLKHMIQIVSALHSLGGSELSACVLVVKFDSKIDTQYKATVRYYRDLLPQLFEKNVIIVMTMFDSSERAEQQRKLRGIDIDRIKSNTIREIVESGKLPFKPLLFMMNALPTTKEDVKMDIKERDSILDYISSLTPMSTKRLRVAKTARVREDDDKAIAAIDGEIESYKNRLNELNELAIETFDKVTLKKKQAGDLNNKLKDLEDDRKEKDSSDTIVVNSRTFNTTWSFSGWLSEDFDLSASCEVTNVVKWSNGNCVWKDLEKYHNGIRGRLEGQFMRGLYAELRLETTKRIKYAEEVKSIRSEIDHTETLLHEVDKGLIELESSKMRHHKQIKDLIAYIQERNERKHSYTQIYMSIEEACDRLKKMSESILVCEDYEPW